MVPAKPDGQSGAKENQEQGGDLYEADQEFLACPMPGKTIPIELRLAEEVGPDLDSRPEVVDAEGDDRKEQVDDVETEQGTRASVKEQTAAGRPRGDGTDILHGSHLPGAHSPRRAAQPLRGHHAQNREPEDKTDAPRILGNKIGYKVVAGCVIEPREIWRYANEARWHPPRYCDHGRRAQERGLLHEGARSAAGQEDGQP